MSPSIDIDQDVLDELGRRARPFIDTTPNKVIRALLGLDSREHDAEGGRPTSSAPTVIRRNSAVRAGGRGRHPMRVGAPTSKHTRARKGSLLDEREYEIPILKALEEHGGRAAAREVVERVGHLVDDALTPMDRETLDTGGVRWQTRVQFARLRLKERGLLKPDSPRGTWEISDSGRAWLRESARGGAGGAHR